MPDDGPSHLVVIKDQEGTEMRRLGPMALGRAYIVKHRLENDTNAMRAGETAEIIDSPGWDFENNREKANVDTDKDAKREGDGR